MSILKKINHRARRLFQFGQKSPVRAKPTPPPTFSTAWVQQLEADWSTWQNAVEAARSDPHVLIATSAGGFGPGTTVESMLAVALTLRGARVHILLCDEALPACIQAMHMVLPDEAFVRDGIAPHLCGTCFTPANQMYEKLGLSVERYSAYLTVEDKASAASLAKEIPFGDIENYKLDGLAVGEHALAGALRYYARGTLEGEPNAEPILRRFLQAALLSVFAMRRVLSATNYTSICFHHGIYVPQGLIGEVARQRNVRVINWNPAYRKQCFVFSHHDTYHRTFLDEPTSNWDNMSWNAQMEQEIVDYLQSRAKGSRDWIWFFEKPEEAVAAIAAQTGIDFSKPCIGLLTNVMWDAQLHYRPNAFPNMLNWVLATIDYFAKRPDLQLVIRVHPAEVRGTLPSRQPIAAEIAKRYPTLPPNVFIVAPESQVSSYTLMECCDTVLIYGTKMGMELSSLGIPVVVAGEAWIRNKSISMDVSSPEQYFQILDKLPLKQRLDETTLRRARQYAYHFFFRRMIPLEMMEPQKGWPPYRFKLDSLNDLLPGRQAGLDIVCNGILSGTEFIYPAEQLGLPVNN